ncbi:hypothetical protein [Dongia deserti]|uniref:hypothetical protein n=1 Tax=Dongia deserti TaxID=2268030 RepID=UPI000E65250A|nr:hypothetical protein [Dongia deserti]
MSAPWTDDDLETLAWLVERYGAPSVTEKAKASGNGRGHPPGNRGDMLAVWTAVEFLMRRDGIYKTAACDRIAAFAKKLFGAEVTGYGTSSLAKLHTEAERYYEGRPRERAFTEKTSLAEAIATYPRNSVLIPLRGPEGQRMLAGEWDVPPDVWPLFAEMPNGKKPRE